jgi:hypothetical protein
MFFLNKLSWSISLNICLIDDLEHFKVILINYIFYWVNPIDKINFILYRFSVFVARKRTYIYVYNYLLYFEFDKIKFVFRGMKLTIKKISCHEYLKSIFRCNWKFRYFDKWIGISNFISKIWTNRCQNLYKTKYYLIINSIKIILMFIPVN